ncbi:hypothetical protein D9M68_871790 [compost metagenome]
MIIDGARFIADLVTGDPFDHQGGADGGIPLAGLNRAGGHLRNATVGHARGDGDVGRETPFFCQLLTDSCHRRARRPYFLQPFLPDTQPGKIPGPGQVMQVKA